MNNPDALAPQMNITEYIPADDWDGFWRHFNVLLDPPPPLESWAVMPGCLRVHALLHGHGCHRLLEAASGIGLKAIALQHLGFDVVGMDGSPDGVALSQRLASAVGVPVPVHCLTWAEAPARFHGEFDAVFNDQTLNSRTLDTMAEAARCAYAALRPGGLFLFGGRPPGEWEMTAPQRVAQHWATEPPSSIAWVNDNPERRITALWLRTRYQYGIHAALIQLCDRSGEPRVLTTSGFFTSFRWNWDDCLQVMRACGFSHVFQTAEDAADPSSLISGVAVR